MPRTALQAYQAARELGAMLAENLLETAIECGYVGVFGQGRTYSLDIKDVQIYWQVDLEEAALRWKPILALIDQDVAFRAWRAGLMTEKTLLPTN